MKSVHSSAEKRHLLYPILVTALLSFLLLSLSRIGLSLWQMERVTAADGWLHILGYGLQIDSSSLSYLLAVPALLTLLLAGEHLLGRIWLRILRCWIVFGLWLIVFMEIATPSFIMEYDVRPNRLFIEYLIYPKEVMRMLWGGYKLELLVSLLVTSLTLFLSWKLSGRLVANLRYPAWKWRIVLVFVVLVVGVLGGRSSLGHRPLNPAKVAFSNDPLVNDLILNSSYSMLFALKQMGSEDDAFKHYGSMDEANIIQQVRQSMQNSEAEFSSDTHPTLSFRPASYQGKPKNLVILLQESLGARYVGALGGMPLTPSIDALMAEGWSFSRMYATGTRSVRGIEAVTTGFSPTPARAVVKLGKSQSGFFTIAALLKQHGYHTQFVYGGESHFDNMKSFFLGNGFTDMQDFPTFTETKFVGAWGASDGDLYDKAHQQYELLSKGEKPFFSLVFTSSNHSPFDYPDNTIELYNQPKQTRENAAKYSDHVLGQFIEKAKASDYWDDTIFIVIADHDSRAYGDQLVPVDHFHIPAVIVGGGVEHRQDDRLVSQIDIPPTLLSLVGISDYHPMIGHDLTQEVPVAKQRAIMQFYKNFAWMNSDNEVVILQPEKPAQGFIYHPETADLLPQPSAADNAIEMARAQALWGSLAYRKGYYGFTIADQVPLSAMVD